MEERKYNRITIVISITALLISLAGIYFQFFYSKRSLVFTALMIEHNDNRDLEVPLVFKNLGTTEEVLLNTTLHLEVKTENDTISYFKRISEYNSKEYPLMLSPNENKLIRLKSNYKNYFGGLVITNLDSITGYCPIRFLDNLKLILNIEYISSNGNMCNENFLIAELSFNDEKYINLIKGEPIKLRELEINSDSEMTGYYSMPKTFSNGFSINLNDSSAVEENKDALIFIENLLEDSLKVKLYNP